ncbi:free fatty acid receptor 2-like [Sphaerodactylus townsendi]|uniref:free fatty acid receptor 2-like n=1 Tax=Sphaerodactylus townsendi TaxID=933632 RepID=UPI0020275146|nr:free fatty acid receptor 2-like [Sphaerodactylus townsendi]XP_048357865.1 free fatty acid receptor 2-like [Sphaerodactylus townsendi]
MTNLVVLLVIYIITFLIGFPSNLLALYTFIVKVRKKPAPIDILLLNLTLSDLTFLVFLPLKMREAALNNEWPFPKALCTVTSCTFHSTIYISTLFLTAISVDRYLGVVFPIKYKLNRRLVYAVVASIFIWVLVVSHCSTVFVVSTLRNNSIPPSQDTSKHVVCFKEFNERQKKIMYPFRLELCIVLFCIPFIITCFCYVNVIRILASLPNVKPRKKQRAVGLATFTLLNYAVCFGLFNISHIFGVIYYEDPTWREYSFGLSTFNTCLDPFIFFFSSNAMRRNVGACWAGICSRFRSIIPRCSLPCCKDSGDHDEGGTAVGLSTSSGLGGTGVSTDSSSDHVAKMWEVSALRPEQEAHGTKFQRQQTH